MTQKAKNMVGPYPLCMKNTETGELLWIPVTEETYQEVSRMLNAFRRKMQRHGCCRCGRRYWARCIMDCGCCEFQIRSEFASLEEETGKNRIEGKQIRLVSDVADAGKGPEELVLEQEQRERLMAALDAIDPVNSRIVMLWAYGLHERRIAELMGLSKSTVNERKRKTLGELRAILE